MIDMIQDDLQEKDFAKERIILNYISFFNVVFLLIILNPVILSKLRSSNGVTTAAQK